MSAQYIPPFFSGSESFLNNPTSLNEPLFPSTTPITSPTGFQTLGQNMKPVPSSSGVYNFLQGANPLNALKKDAGSILGSFGLPVVVILVGALLVYGSFKAG